MNIDPATLEQDLLDGTFRRRLEEELTAGFTQLHDLGERLPPASHYAAQIAEIVNRGLTLTDNTKYELYQEILDAVSAARAAVLGEDEKPN
ncbi:MAG TPA: hypothetical protein VFO89_01255 [Thermoanaerobaculia bacterium]|nr:hypothetical protein [Thermoanaerobaculia bacterium]